MAKKHKKRVLVQEEVDDEEPVSDDKGLEHDEELDGAGGRATVGKKRQGTGREKGKAGRGEEGKEERGREIISRMVVSKPWQHWFRLPLCYC